MKKFILITIFIAISGMLHAATYYVSTTGNDGWSGTSQSSPWRHIAHASSVVAAGDTVFIDNGVYTDEHIIIANSGTFIDPIVFMPLNDQYILDGVDNSGIAIRMIDKSFISFSGFYITRYATAVQGEGTLSHITLTHFDIKDINGIGLKFDGASIQNSLFSYFTIRNTNNFAITHFDYSSTDCHDIEISHFLIRDITNSEAINWRNSRKVHIHHGEIYNIASDAIHLQLSIDSSIVENIRIDTTGWHGIAIHDHTVGTYPCHDNIIRNCYVANTGHNLIDLHSGAFNTIVDSCILEGTPATGQAIYFHNLGAGLIASNNIIKGMHRGIYAEPSAGYFIRNVLFKNNTIYYDERYSGCYSSNLNELTNVRFIDNTFISCGSQAGYNNLMLMYGDTLLAEGNSFINSLRPDDPQIYVRGSNNVLILNLKDRFTRIQVKDSEGRLEFTNGRVFSENGAGTPFWYPSESKYIFTINETFEVSTYDLFVTPSSDSMEVNIIAWDTTGVNCKQWEEICSNPLVTTSHLVGGFPVNAVVNISVNGNYYGSYTTDTSGWITFNYIGGFSSSLQNFEACLINTSIVEFAKNPVKLNIYPNPSKGKAQIEFNLTKIENVQISIYNILGEEIGIIANGEMSMGDHKFDISNYLSVAGVYILRIKTGNTVNIRKLLNVK